jgi:hypothetical protein
MPIYLHESTIKKIFREHFRGETPITIPAEPEQVELLTELKNQLSTRTTGRVSSVSWSMQSGCCFEIISTSPYYQNQSFCVRFNKQHELIITTKFYWSINSPVYQLEQIYTLIETKMPVEYDRLNKLRAEQTNNVIKRKKIKSLKHTAILATIHEIAKEDKFEFRIHEYANKVKLIVRLTKTEQLEVDIPYSRFQETLKNLRDTIQQIRGYYELGLTFKVRSYLRERNPQWIQYD